MNKPLGLDVKYNLEKTLFCTWYSLQMSSWSREVEGNFVPSEVEESLDHSAMGFSGR